MSNAWHYLIRYFLSELFYISSLYIDIIYLYLEVSVINAHSKKIFN